MELRVAVAGGAPCSGPASSPALALDDRLRLVDQDTDVEHAGELLRRKACDVLVLSTESPHAEVGVVSNGSAGDPERPKVLVLTDVESQHELLGALQKGSRATASAAASGRTTSAPASSRWAGGSPGRPPSPRAR